MTENDAGTRVGWIGLGAMGFPMAGCVARAGFDVSAYDIDPGPGRGAGCRRGEAGDVDR